MDAVLEPGSRMAQLFDGIASGQIYDDESAKVILEKKKKGDPVNLPSLKNKLKERLIDSVFLLDYKDGSFSTRQKAFFECYKKWAAAMILLTRNSKAAGIDILEKLLRNTMRFEFTELSLDILRVLRLQYSTIDGDMKKYEQVKAQFAQYRKIWEMENRAEDYYAEIMAHFTNSKSAKIEITDLARKYYDELAPFMEECASFKLHLFGRLIHMLVYNTVNDYRNTALLCEDAVVFFDQKDYDSGLPLQVFYYNLIVCYLQLQEFEKGRVIVEKADKYFEEGTFNWFKLRELFFMLAMHTGHYDEAYELYQIVTEHPKYKNQPSLIKEIWGIYKAYILYLIKIGQVSDHLVREKDRKFRVGKFISEMLTLSKDKRGMNISILIVQILYGIAERDYAQTGDRIEAIEKYCTRYLKENDTYRSNCFIKMLLQIPTGMFHRANVERKAERYYKLLKKAPLEAANQAHEIEIIPYEQLWELTLATLSGKIVQTRSRN